MTEDVKIFAKTLEEEASEQIFKFKNHPVSDGSKIRIMPDAHAGAGCTIGTTMTITDRVCPNLVGVDIGCGVLACHIPDRNIDLEKLDSVIKENIPSGMNIRNDYCVDPFIDNFKCPIDKERATRSMGTLGGGNHFIEVDRVYSDNFLVIHTGSRHLGLEVANYYQKLAEKYFNKPPKEKADEIIRHCKDRNEEKEIQSRLAELKLSYEANGSRELAYLRGDDMNDYLHDMELAQKYATHNRELIAEIIFCMMGWKYSADSNIESVHNYIDTRNGILRKGAVSAQKGEYIVIPMNMRDGTLFCVGKGNEDWNFSAPHGAGRSMSRTKAKKTVTIDEFKDSMSGIYSTTVCEDTLDESPFAYKDKNEIMECISETCEVSCVARPIYNFKATT